MMILVTGGARSGKSRHAEALIADPDINAVAIVTQHNTHARFATQALRAGKHVFVEKPLALTQEELDMVQEAHAEANCHLMVGFNRRFSPLVEKMMKLMSFMSAHQIFLMLKSQLRQWSPVNM